MSYYKKTYKTIVLILGIIITSCIEKYTPEITDLDINKIVVNGGVTDTEGFQSVFISRSTDMSKPRFIPVSNCDVKISDNKGNLFQLYEDANGEYQAYFEQKYLTEGTAFKVDVLTPDGQLISSEYDTLHVSPEIDSVYYIKEDILTSNPEYNIQGIQFYIDYNGQNTNAKYIRWDLYETYEYHAKYPIQFLFDSRGFYEIDPPDYSKNVCWATKRVLIIFTLSTNNLAENKYLKYPLHYVNNKTQRLAYGYSLLVKQYSLSEQAYNYYQQLQLNVNNEGGLYDTQPFQIEGNLSNVSNPNKIVLGFFYAGGVKLKRTFIHPIEELPMEFNHMCTPTKIVKYQMLLAMKDDYPLVILDGYLLLPDCYDCTVRGGTLTKPDFWPY